MAYDVPESLLPLNSQSDVADNERTYLIQKAMSKLTETQREVITQYFYNGHNSGEISEMGLLGKRMTAKRVRQLKARALEKLRPDLEVLNPNSENPRPDLERLVA